MKPSPALHYGIIKPNNRKAIYLPLFFIFIPVLTLYAVCFRFLCNIPVFDDYDSVLGFLNKFVKLPSGSSKFAFVLFAQHNEYKPVFANAIVALQYRLSGHTNFVLLSILGDIQVLAIAWFFWRCFLPKNVDLASRLTLFVPISFILFQLNYGETLDWPMPCLQNIGVVLFALIALYAATKVGRLAFAIACMGLALSIAASGNGFALFPVGMLLFLQERKPWRAAVWTLVTIACAAIYIHHYNFASSQQGGGTVHSAAHHLNVIYTLSFLGASIGLQRAYLRYLSILLGIVICALLLLAMRRRFYRVNPTVSYYALFLLLTGLGVSGIRSGLGYDQSLSSRYKIYSDLLLVCCYVFSLHELARISAERIRRFYKAAVVASGLFFLAGTALGAYQMHRRYVGLLDGMTLYKSSGGTQGPMLAPPGPDHDVYLLHDEDFRPILERAEKNAIYHVP